MLSILSMGRVVVNGLLRKLLACQALAAILFASASSANDDSPTSECPSVADVLAGLAQVVTSRAAVLPPGDIVIHDYGDTWAVEVRGHRSTYSDAARNCVERTRVATVFAALVLDPIDADTPLPERSAQVLTLPQLPVRDSIVVSPDSPVEKERSWHFGVRSSLDYFSGGRTLAGGDIFLASSWRHWFVAELSAGGRVGADEPIRGGRLTTRAATVAAAAGLALPPRGRWAGSAVAQVQAYLVHFDAQQAPYRADQTALLDGWTITVEPRLALATTRRLSLAASAGAGYALRPIIIREQGITQASMSGLVLCAHVGGDFAF